jgi:hypothetical protein
VLIDGLPVKFGEFSGKFPQNSNLPLRTISVKLNNAKLIRTRKKTRLKAPKKTVDASLEKSANLTDKKRGRRPEIPPSWVTGRAFNYGYQLASDWPALEGALLKATNPDEVTAAFLQYSTRAGDFVPAFAAEILQICCDPDFPKKPVPRIRFLARSLAGMPRLSGRRSRDICEAAEKIKSQKPQHRILRCELYIECTCGYRGPALDNACRRCRAEIPRSIEFFTGKFPEPDPEAKELTLDELYARALKRTSIVATAEPTPSSPNSARCECGTSIFASTPKLAQEMLAKHKREQHGT